MQFNLGIVISSYNWSETVVRISVTGLSSEKDNLNHFAIILPSLSMLSLCLQSEQVKKMKKSDQRGGQRTPERSIFFTSSITSNCGFTYITLNYNRIKAKDLKAKDFWKTIWSCHHFAIILLAITLPAK